MIEKSFKVSNKMGLHARVASKFVQLTNKFISDIQIEYNGDQIDGKSIMCIISMGISKDSMLKVKIVGPDEDSAMYILEEFFKNDILDV